MLIVVVYFIVCVCVVCDVFECVYELCVSVYCCMV